MDFLLECIGFPPDQDLDLLADRVAAQGEPTPWRGPRGRHLRLPLTGGLEVQLDQEEHEERPSLWPHYRAPGRLRVEVGTLTEVPDSPFDVLLVGIANPPTPGQPPELREEFPLCTYLTDRRRLPRETPRGHVLAVSTAGFALDVGFVGPNEGVRDPQILEFPCGALFLPLGGPGGSQDPGGCMEISVRIRQVRHLENPLTGLPVAVLEVDAPGRPLQLFVSRWQLEVDDLPQPRPGWRIEGCFLFTGRVAGGLPPARPRRRRAFG